MVDVNVREKKRTLLMIEVVMRPSDRFYYTWFNNKTVLMEVESSQDEDQLSSDTPVGLKTFTQ